MIPKPESATGTLAPFFPSALFLEVAVALRKGKPRLEHRLKEKQTKGRQQPGRAATRETKENYEVQPHTHILTHIHIHTYKHTLS